MVAPVPVVIEAADVSDAGELLTLQRAAYVTEAQLHDDLGIPALSQTLDDLVDELHRRTAWKAVDPSGRIVGSVRVSVDGTTAVVHRLAVAPDRQGSGIGTALMAHVRSTVPAQVRAIELFTGERSEANIRLYERLGYVEYARTRLPAGYDLVHLRLDTGGAPPA